MDLMETWTSEMSYSIDAGGASILQRRQEGDADSTR